MLIAFATLVGIAIGVWQGHRLGFIEGQDREHNQTCSFLLTLAPTEVHSPRELTERIGKLEHRKWSIK